jgi:hypothetical protein
LSIVNPLKQIEKQIQLLNPHINFRRKRELNRSKKAARDIYVQQLAVSGGINDHPNAVIALEVGADGKNWAWNQRTGLPNNLADPDGTSHLLRWAGTQPFWANKNFTINGQHLSDAIVEVTLSYCEDRIDRIRYARAIRDAIAAGIKAHKESQRVDAEAAVQGGSAGSGPSETLYGVRVRG